MSARGFHLLEILITLMIVGILSAISLPIYTAYLTKTKRFAAETTLMKLAVVFEKYYIEHQTYASLTIPPDMISHHSAYRFHLLVNNQHYRLAAEPIGKQCTSDALCGTLFLTDLGEKSVSGTEPASSCW